jgi:23S rRNA (pseudouridine1915-N3)-methyltransferase
VRITIAAVGKARAASPEQELCDLYYERARALGPKLGVSKLEFIEVETSRAANAEARMNEEAVRLSKRLPEAAYLIALDEKGRSMSSDAFAKHIGKLRDTGVRDAVFLIGGPDGLASSLRDRAKDRLALGAQTWPHLLVRAMLAEQIYRGCSILAGHPYHRAG